MAAADTKVQGKILWKYTHLPFNLLVAYENKQYCSQKLKI